MKLRTCPLVLLLVTTACVGADSPVGDADDDTQGGDSVSSGTVGSTGSGGTTDDSGEPDPTGCMEDTTGGTGGSTGTTSSTSGATNSTGTGGATGHGGPGTGTTSDPAGSSTSDGGSSTGGSSTGGSSTGGSSTGTPETGTGAETGSGASTGTGTGSGTGDMGDTGATPDPGSDPEGPFIFTATRSAGPGQVIGLQGDQFGSTPEVWIDPISGNCDAPSLEQAVEILTASDDYIAARLPEDLPLGLYAVFVRSGDRISPAAWINRAEPWQVLDLAGNEVSPGATFRIAGWNMDLAGATPTVRFVRLLDGSSAPAAVMDTDGRETLVAAAPATLVPGEAYDLYVANGHGATRGEVVGPRIWARSVSPDPFGLQVPWAAEFDGFAANRYDVTQSPYGAAGDGISDDSGAIQTAIDDASAAGGGVVHLPAGTYNVDGATIVLKANVVLEGAGPDDSTLYDDTGTPGRAMVELSGDRVGISGLRVETSGAFREVVKTVSLPRRFAFAVDSVFIHRGDGGEYWTLRWERSENALVRDCEIESTATETTGSVVSFARSRDILFQDNLLRWGDSRLRFTHVDHLQFEGNELVRSVESDEGGGPNITLSRHCALLDNNLSKTGDGDIPNPGNTGEAILAEDDIATPSTFGAVTSAGSDWIQADKSWTPGVFELGRVMIIQGPGMGQIRTVVSNDANTLSIDEPWTVAPNTDSRFAVYQHTFGPYLIRNNTLADQPYGISLYSHAAEDVIVTGNRLTDTGEISIRAHQRDDRFAFFRSLLVEDNTVTNTRYGPGSHRGYAANIRLYMAQFGNGELYGNGFYGAVVRGNTIDGHYHPGDNNSEKAPGEGYFAHVSQEADGPDDDTPGVLGVIFEGNHAQDMDHAYYVNTGSYQTVIWDATQSDVSTLVRDIRSAGATHASVDTVVN